MLETLKHWDRELFVYLNNLGIGHYDGFWIYVTQIDSWTPLFILFFILVFYYYKSRKGAVVFIFVLLTFATTFLFTALVKDYVARLRPNNVEALGELIRVLQKPTNYSFFSGHASSSFCITTFIVLALRQFTKWIYLAYLWPLLFVMSRIFVGVHYPSDIFVGALVGTAFGYAFHIMCQHTLRHKRLFPEP